MAKFLLTMLPANDLGLPTRIVPIAGRSPIAATKWKKERTAGCPISTQEVAQNEDFPNSLIPKYFTGKSLFLKDLVERGR